MVVCLYKLHLEGIRHDLILLHNWLKSQEENHPFFPGVFWLYKEKTSKKREKRKENWLLSILKITTLFEWQKNVEETIICWSKFSGG